MESATSRRLRSCAFASAHGICPQGKGVHGVPFGMGNAYNGASDGKDEADAVTGAVTGAATMGEETGNNGKHGIADAATDAAADGTTGKGSGKDVDNTCGAAGVDVPEGAGAADGAAGVGAADAATGAVGAVRPFFKYRMAVSKTGMCGPSSPRTLATCTISCISSAGGNQ